MARILASTGAGLLLATAYAASPLGVVSLAAAALLCTVAGSGLPSGERRLLAAVLTAAVTARFAYIAAAFWIGIPHHNDLSLGAVAGDGAYNLSRALRMRDILVGLADSRYDHFVVTDEYGRSSYLDLLTWLQMLFGPTPYGGRALNAVFFVGGTTVLFRLARAAFGSTPAFAGLLVALSLPSLFISSVSLLKESLYLLVSATCLWTCVQAVRARSLHVLAFSACIIGISLWLLDGLRRGAFLLTVAGLVFGLAIRAVGGHRWRTPAAVLAVAVGLLIVWVQPDLRSRAIAGVEQAAKIHTGHVFTVGHAYKLLDAGYYANPGAPLASTLTLVPEDALRFVARAAVSFVVTPLPWETISRGELANLPEHLVWILMVGLLPIGVVAGWKRDPLVVAMLVGYVLPTAAVIALTTGNVGTLVRLRGLVSPYLVWVSVLGFLACADALARRPARSGAGRSPGVEAKGTMA